ncbi:MAG: Rrf2 family transcriptional regulator [Alphaproteobacteria bacterium]|nr:Rrf2 family transcriptional regulator [Alphaproteobacteria bacterium]MBF0250957.1 Rrf2 family transcriptional regulator [Alphaproteobacteria bacterium]
MKLSTKGRYAVMAMADLGKGDVSKPMALADVADRQEISLSYLEQLFGKLRRAGLVKSVRGPGGGYLLSRPADQIRVSDVISAVDEPITATRCTKAEGCHSDKARCLTHDLWTALSYQIHLYLNSVTLADVCARRVLGPRPDLFGETPDIGGPGTIAAE